MRTEMRPQELTRHVAAARRHTRDSRALAAGRLLDVYAQLAASGAHLLSGLLHGKAPRQWRHYPEDDASDAGGGYQWFYHSHSPEDRPGAGEHGHFHLFARRRLWSRRLRSAAERNFLALTGHPDISASTRHLLGIGLDAKGVPISLFTVNSWVTGDRMLSASTTASLLSGLVLATSHPQIDAVLECVVALCRDDIQSLLASRDAALRRHAPAGVLDNTALEVLSEAVIDLDARLAAC